LVPPLSKAFDVDPIKHFPIILLPNRKQVLVTRQLLSILSGLFHVPRSSWTDTEQLLHHSDRGCQISFALFFVAISSFLGDYIKDDIFPSKLELVDGVKQSEDEKKALS
jgi:hypothetical protein